LEAIGFTGRWGMFMVYSIQQNGYLVYHKYYDRFKFILGLIYEPYKLVIDKNKYLELQGNSISWVT
jgi:hypothetical protein